MESKVAQPSQKTLKKIKPPAFKLTDALGQAAGQDVTFLSLQLMMACLTIEYIMDYLNDIAGQQLQLETRVKQLEFIQDIHGEIIKGRVVTPEEYQKLYHAYIGVEGPLQ